MSLSWNDLFSPKIHFATSLLLQVSEKESNFVAGLPLKVFPRQSDHTAA